MIEYIPYEAVVDYLNKAHYYDNESFKNMIDKIQSGDVQPVVHSNWKEIDGTWFCPECDEEYPQWYGEPSWRFCPMCGARMDLKE